MPHVAAARALERQGGAGLETAQALARHWDGAGQPLRGAHHWVEAGRADETFSPGLHHNVSNTVTVGDHEWDEVAEFVWNHREHFTGIALLTDVGDKTYLQAPREEITTDDDVRKWNALVYQPVDYAQMREMADATALRQELACAGGTCELTVMPAAS